MTEVCEDYRRVKFPCPINVAARVIRLMDNVGLINTFVECVAARKSILVANAELRIEPIGSALQLWAKQEGMISSARFDANIPFISVKDTAQHWSVLHDTLIAHHFLPTQPEPGPGFYRYESAHVPRDYEVNYSDGLLFLQAWWHYRQQNPQAGLLGMLLWHGKSWHPIRVIECDRGVLNVATWGSQIVLQPAERVVWLLKIQSEDTELWDEEPSPGSSPRQTSTATTKILSNSGASMSSLQTSSKCIGNYLVEAGLLSTAQVDVILSDQSSTGMRFGEIAVSRGWLKEQTIEYLMKHLISPQQSATQDQLAISDESVIELLPERPPRKKTEPSSDSIHERETLVISMKFDDDWK